MEKDTINRRQFLKGSISTAISASILGCSSDTSIEGGNRTNIDGIDNKPWSFPSNFLQGNNYPQLVEIERENLPVTGFIPDDIQGAFLRNGPNPQFEPITFAHPFDGDGMVHGLYIKDGIASYRNRWVETQGLLNERQANMSLYRTFEKNPANTHIIGHHGRLLALYEGGLPYELDNKLNTIGQFDFNGNVQDKVIAHPKIDPETQELHFCRYYVTQQPALTYYRADAAGNIALRADIPIPYNTMVHDMTITSDYVIFVITPLMYDQTASPTWQSNQPTTIVTVEKSTGKVVGQSNAPQLFFWHFQNSYQDSNSKIHVDLVRYGGPTFSVKNSPGMRFQKLTRLSIDLLSNTTQIFDVPYSGGDFVTTNPMFVGKEYQFGYVPSRRGRPPYPLHFNRLTRTDMLHNQPIHREFADNQYISEVSVIPKPEARHELEAYIIGFLYDDAMGTSDVILIDAEDFTGPPVALIHLNSRVPSGFHGSWINELVFD